MANSQGFGADAAYERAIGAFDEKSYDVARRWVLEALAQDPEHARARALLSRLDAVRRPPTSFAPGGAGRPASPYGHSASTPAPEVVSTDPTILISHASRAPAAEPIEPTIMVQRAPARRVPAPDPFTPSRPAARDTAPTPAEPTVIGRTAAPPPVRPRVAADSGGFLQRWKELFGGSGAPPSRPAAPRVAASRPGGFGPGVRGAALVVGAVAVAALLLWGGIAAAQWFWPAGQSLTVTKPSGGTIVALGIECGTKGNDCSTTRPTGDPVELAVQADAGYVFSGFTGDCAPAGRIMMSEPRTCGARFEPTAPAPSAVTFPLTITKPVGGTIAGEPNILCGTLDTVCSANIASGTPVTMRFQADNNFAFQAFTGDCAPNGDLTMNAAKTCGAIFMPTPGAAVINNTGGTGPGGARRAPGGRSGSGERGPSKPDVGAQTVAPPPPPPPPPEQGTGTKPTEQTRPPDGPVKREISAEEHAQAEIDDLVKRFCTAHETLKVEGIQKMFPLAPEETYRYQFRQYKTLKCSITSKPEFVRLDARSAGAAQVKFGMKQVIQMRIGGQPEVKETIVTMTLSRTEFQTPWLIDRIAAEEKPK
jgi:List-Bact-rpt repeat protein